jgi:hypothetical protein
MTDDQDKLLRDAMAELERAPEGTRVQVRVPPGLAAAPDDGLCVLVVSHDGVVAAKRKLGGRHVSLREMGLELVAAEAALDAALDAQGPAPAAELSRDEAALLDDAGFTAAEPDAVGALERSRIELQLLLRRSLTLEQAGKRLSVSPSRLRQRLSGNERSLYGFKEGAGWRIPTFQLVGKKVVPGIAEVVPHLRPDAHPLSVVRWFSTPHQDLVVGAEDTPVSPLRWLAAGLSPLAVAELAGEV